MAYIITAVAVVLAIIFALLGKLWAGFVYFVLCTLLLLALFWGVWLIFKYFTDFKQELKEKYKLFKAEKINKYQISAQYFDENDAQYKKEFSKKVLKDKIMKWFVILFCFAVAVAFLLGMILY